MIKSKTRGGHPCFVFNIEIPVTLMDFSKTLSEKKYSDPESLDFSDLTKTEAKSILEDRIPWHGRRGEYQGLDDLGDHQDEMNRYYEEAEQWVLKNHPYLKNQK